jgi:hypothetical protein
MEAKQDAKGTKPQKQLGGTLVRALAWHLGDHSLTSYFP